MRIAVWWCSLAVLGGLNPLWGDGPESAGELLERTRRAMAGIETLEADLEGTIGTDHFAGTLVLKRPNLARLKVDGTDQFKGFTLVSDGTNLWTYFPAKAQYIRSIPGDRGANIHGLVAQQVEEFFRPDRIGLNPSPISSQYLGREARDGVEYHVLALAYSVPLKKTVKYLISTKDGLIHHVVTTTEHNGATATRSASLNNVRVNANIPSSAFRWQPPPGATLLQARKDCCSVERKKRASAR